MPNGKTHAILTATASSIIFSVGNYLKIPVDVSVSMAVGSMVGLIMNPDLDQAESRSGLWYLLWWPYGKAIKHRAILSHFPIVSTLVRVIYIFGLPVTYLWWNYRIENWSHWNLIWYGILGLMISDGVHSIADIVTTEIKRMF